ncbi:aldo/keto reductase [Stappia taiwanensis]|uniref:Aldo/keto reductase n=1 Tax=Stappia taiwanensis TaxID=992267 RepID=A0A838XLD1_9HYPH|nr:aldo/keto reductase [Stappia taiwanensis]MBA4610657.1 aldo/keto reductase [Stappia taiwanensis]GGE83239.1 oxidoreductase [Stappia taiwanensis]
MKYLSLSGVEMPALGLGTWPLSGEICRDVVRAALEGGWSHVDTAAMYDNEKDVGAGLRAASLPRDRFFLTTKVWHDQLDPEKMVRSCEDSLDRLGLEHVDLFLIHWPNPAVPLKEQIEALLELRDRGWTRAIGVSNFTAALVREAQELAGGTLAVNQVEYHPMLSQRSVKAALDDAGMALTAYSPIGKGSVLAQETLRDIGKRHGKSAVQVSLRWLMQQDNVAAIPKTANPARLVENAAIFDFELTEAEMAAITALGSAAGRGINPSFAPHWDAD